MLKALHLNVAIRPLQSDDLGPRKYCHPHGDVAHASAHN